MTLISSRKAPYTGSVFTAVLAAALLFGGSGGTAYGQSQPVLELSGLQMHSGAAYNSAADEYAVTVTGESLACVVRISPNGTVVSVNRIAPPAPAGNPYNISTIEYDPQSNTYLATYRNDQPQLLNGRFLGASGAPVSAEFRITDRGGAGKIEHNPTRGNFMISWDFGLKYSEYSMVGGPASDNPPRSAPVRFGAEFLGVGSFNSKANKFLYVTGEEQTGNQSNVYGRFVTGDGSVSGGRFGIATSAQDETSFEVGYAPSSNRWLVMWQRYVGPVRTFDAQAALVNADGSVGAPFYISQTEGWEVPQAIEYNESLDRFVVVWFNSNPRIALVNPHDGTVEHVIPDDAVQVFGGGDLGAGVNAMATRPHAGNPQALVVWRQGHGLTGVFATIVDLKSGAQIPVTGGKTSCPDAPQVTPAPVPPPVATAVPGQQPVSINLTPDRTPYVIPAAAVSLPVLKVQKFIRNVSKLETASRAESAIGLYDIVQFIIQIDSQSDRAIGGLVVKDILPPFMTFKSDSTFVQGDPVAGSDVIGAGLAVGTIQPKDTIIVRWSAQVTSSASLPAGITTASVPVLVTTPDDGTFSSDGTVTLSVPGTPTSAGTGTPGISGGAGQPQTGPAGATVIALIMAAGSALMYAGYTRSDRFRHGQAERAARQHDPMNFTA